MLLKSSQAVSSSSRFSLGTPAFFKPFFIRHGISNQDRRVSHIDNKLICWSVNKSANYVKVKRLNWFTY